MGAAFVGAGTASAAPASPLWRATRAPGDLQSLFSYALQPPEGETPGENQVEEDTTREFEPVVPTIETGPGGTQQPGQQPPPPAFALPDSTGRLDSLFAVPTRQAAPVETIGPQSSFLPAPTSQKQPVKSKRGVFGLHPAALIAGMVVLHIFIVGLATK